MKRISYADLFSTPENENEISLEAYCVLWYLQEPSSPRAQDVCSFQTQEMIYILEIYTPNSVSSTVGHSPLSQTRNPR